MPVHRRARTTLAATVLAVTVLAVTVLTVTALALTATAGTAAASTAASQATAGPVGPAPISPLGHPGLCWEAWGNGSAVTLEKCDPALQGQSWTFTGRNNVLMNGNGYCAQNGGSTPSSTNGPPPAGSDTVFLSFAGQCSGSPSQSWTFSGRTNQVTNTPAGVCAYVAGDALVPGAVIVARRCSAAGHTSIWSMGVSNLALSAPKAAAGSGPAAGRAATGRRAATGTRRDFTGAVAISNAVAVSRSADAMTAYGAVVSVQAPQGFTVTRLTPVGLAGWSCTARARTCQGNLPGGDHGQILVEGTVSGVPAASTLTASATVAHTNQSPHAKSTSAVLAVRTFSPPAAASAPRAPGSSVMMFGLIAGILVVLGVCLALVTRRRRPAPGPRGAVPPGGPQHETAPLPPTGAVTLIKHTDQDQDDAPVKDTRDNTAVLPAVSSPAARPLLRHRGRPAGYRRPRRTTPVRHARPVARDRPDTNQDAPAGPPK
jgi:hypothetical protein